ncbi:MAG: ABC transporter ATP-binding protein [Planctomycetota bacterium]|nr:MAG: ABC transporter ATP-binding protein [Planctomycetota bacterium]
MRRRASEERAEAGRSVLRVQEVTKRYGEVLALDRISFEIGRGEVVGFLGANGAGKTTAMRIIAGFVPPSSGRVTIENVDAFADPLAARRLIGYLPESAALYPDLRVGEYLRFRARLKGVERRRRAAEVARAAELCGIEEVLGRPIEVLSRGFRQRVGLADALLGPPRLLVLDEPTAGLDPHQVRQVRELIRSLGPQHTVLLSTHVLSEVEAVCSRALIIHQGRIVAAEPVARAARGAAGCDLEAELVGPAEEIDAVLRALPGVASVQRRALGGGAHAVRLCIEEQRDLREPLGRAALAHGWVVRLLRPVRPSLEEVFVRCTAGADSQPHAPVPAPAGAA